MIKTPLSTMIGGALWTPKATILGSASKTFDQLIKALFANNEQGFAYDPNDLTTMFQDSAGTVPVTGVGQPVGLLLDKSRGLALGSELRQYALARMIGTVPVATYDPATGVGTVNRVDVSNQSFVVFNNTVGGKWYKVSVTSGSASILLRAATDYSVTTVFATIPPFTTFNGYINVGINTMLSIAASSGNSSFTVNTIKEINGNHAYQTTSTSRPILRQNATTGAYYLEFDGSDDFLVTNRIDFTATDKVSLFTGVRKLSDAKAALLCEFGRTVANQGTLAILAPPAAADATYSIGANLGVLAVTKTDAIFPSPLSSVLTTSSVGSPAMLSLRVNASLVALSNMNQGAGTYGNNPLYIGRRDGTSLSFNGHIYSLIGVGRLTTDNEITAIEKELARRTGVVLSV